MSQNLSVLEHFAFYDQKHLVKRNGNETTRDVINNSRAIVSSLIYNELDSEGEIDQRSQKAFSRETLQKISCKNVAYFES